MVELLEPGEVVQPLVVHGGVREVQLLHAGQLQEDRQAPAVQCCFEKRADTLPVKMAILAISALFMRLVRLGCFYPPPPFPPGEGGQLPTIGQLRQGTSCRRPCVGETYQLSVRLSVACEQPCS